MLQTLIVSLLALTLPNLVFAETGKGYLAKVLEQVCGSKLEPIITDASAFDKIDWKNITGAGVLKQKAIFTEQEVEAIREYLNTSGIHVQTYGLDLKLNGLFKNNLDLTKAAGTEAEQKLVRYLNEIKNNIKSRTKRPFKLRAVIRGETALKFEGGHTHAVSTLTITRAELGPSSWFYIGKERLEFNGADEATVFTDEFHGGQNAPKRLIIIIVAKFD